MKIRDPYEPTPVPFHDRVELTLNELQRRQQSVHHSFRWVAVAAACMALLCGTALALEQLGVLHFLTQRTWMGMPVHAAAIAQPTQQHCDSEQLDAFIKDAYWDGETLSIAMYIRPKGDYAFYTETDRGQDGEHFDMIWWNGNILSFEQWKAGRTGLMLTLPRLMNGTEDITSSWDWIQNEQGEIMLIQGNCDDMTQGATLALDLSCMLEGHDKAVLSTLTFTLPPMTKGDAGK